MEDAATNFKSFNPEKITIYNENGDFFFCTVYGHFLFRYVISIKLMILKISPTIVTFLNLGNLEAASEETMELRELINKSNESLILVLEFLGPKT